MSMPAAHHPSPVPEPPAAVPADRLAALAAEIAATRALAAQWTERLERLHQAVEPVRLALLQAWRDWAHGLEDALWQDGLSRGEQAQLRALLVDTAQALLAQGPDDRMAALLQRHGGGAAAAPARADDTAPPAASAAAASQPPVSEDADAGDDPEPWERQARAAAGARARRQAQRREAASQAQARAAQAEAAQSLRAVWRRLASVLHPDREPDAGLRARKTAWMQQANVAYAAGDLQALLALQQQAAQLDATRAAGAAGGGAAAAQLDMLAGQLAQWQAEVRRQESAFRAATGAPPGSGLQAHKADRLQSAQLQRLRADLAALQGQLRLLQDPQQLRAWLRALRQAGRD